MVDSKKHTLEDIFIKYDNKYNLTKKEFKEICKVFNNILMRTIVDTGFEYKLPHRLGSISVRKKKSKGGAIDFAHYKKTGDIIKHTNKHSGGYHAAFYWSRRSPQAIFANKFIYKFFPVRFYKKYLADAIRERNTINKYFDYD